jgi:TolA-binding protein
MDRALCEPKDAFAHGGEGPTTMPAAWARPPAGEDSLDKATFDQAVGLVMNGQYQQASRQFSALLARLETALAADMQAGPMTNPTQPPQPSTAPASHASMATVRMAGECMFWIAYCAEKQGQVAQAATLYNKVLANYPGTPAASQAAKRLNLLHGGGQ